MNKPILCLDFDGVIHSYTSGWQGADVISDPPVIGTKEFICRASKMFEIHIFSSRSNQDGGLSAMQHYVHDIISSPNEEISDYEIGIIAGIVWDTEKPPAMVTIDDRALTFDGTWPDPEELLKFQPWHKRQ
jgi:hypothetical protein